MKKKAIVITSCVLLSLGAGALYSLPYVAIYRIMAAFENQDIEKLAALVDFSEVRENLKRYLGAKILGDPADDPPAAARDLRDSLVARMVDRAVDDLITPEGLAAYMKERLASLAAAGGLDRPNARALFMAFLRHADFAYTSPSEFTVTMPAGEEGEAVRFILRRRGLSWQLAHMEF
ncbi:MAG TPA: DUF2939 domain-containing protein [Syntrophales bacterium]|nr:DUF2939 domain-containing protein [Syntrophales bacterium]HOD97595.1 DUF2939 domain-containing protein [Syntrophales bacterium]HOH72991.1 DUF2939 domain-containing protein [Syntrophales bacterium]HPN08881.1 DUF2939 domain-containing protein [Syntrophales bacterium]HPX81078.1 DUF2939 domain-containing protein [Syntrophales bacterium]